MKCELTVIIYMRHSYIFMQYPDKLLISFNLERFYVIKLECVWNELKLAVAFFKLQVCMQIVKNSKSF